MVVCGFVVGFVYLCGRCLRPCVLVWVLWVVVLFENSIVCHLMKQICCLNMNMSINVCCCLFLFC